MSMNVSVLFDVLEGRLRSLGESQNAPFPLRVIHFLRTIWNICKTFFDNKSQDNSISEYERIFVPQECTWDCGIACCNMILKWNKVKYVPAFDRYIVSSDQKPLWTIELFCLLKEVGLDVSMYTICKGVNPQHKQLNWYANSSADEVAATKERFNQAKSNNWNVHEEELSLELLQTIVSHESAVAVVLVDTHTLHQMESTDYSGHYIVVMDYDHRTDEFTCLNPSRCPGTMLVSSYVLEQARCHEGTDQDVLICRRTTNSARRW